MKVANKKKTLQNRMECQNRTYQNVLDTVNIIKWEMFTRVTTYCAWGKHTQSEREREREPERQRDRNFMWMIYGSLWVLGKEKQKQKTRIYNNK